jgi:hypothetical protein
MSIKQILKASSTGIIIVAAGILPSYIFSRTTTLTCERGQKDQINCVKSENIYGIINFKDEQIPSLENAWVSEDCDYETCTYQVVLHAARGNFPLTSYTSSGTRSKEEIVDQINTFIHSSSEPTLEIETSLGVIGFMLPIVFASFGLLISFWQVRKAILQ